MARLLALVLSRLIVAVMSLIRRPERTADAPDETTTPGRD